MNDNLRETMYKLAMQGYGNAYIPYSHFPVGAGLVTKDHKAFVGANIENSAYGCCICAERTCITSAYAHGIRKEDILAFSVVTDTVEPASPCGVCRQVLSELLEKDTPIFLFNTEGKCYDTTIEDLLPYSFEIEEPVTYVAETSVKEDV